MIEFFSARRMLCLFVIASFAAILCMRAVAAEPAASQPASVTQTLPDGLVITDVGQPSPGAKVGDQVWVHYILKLTDGTEVDNSYKRGEPIPVTLGAGKVIKGWEEGLIGMQVGGKRKLSIPPELGYGAAGSPPVIPANSTLLFDVELMGIKR